MSWSDAFKQSLRRPGFLVVSLVLLIGAVGINAATSAMKLHFRKEALPLRHKDGLAALPLQLGSNWVCVPETRTIDIDTQHELHTDQYVFRDYINVNAKGDGGPVTTREKVLAMDQLTPEGRAAALFQIRKQNPAAVISMAITYYTGKVDTVPHVPERCYVADGFQPSNPQTLTWNLGESAPGNARQVPVRFINFEDQTTRGLQNRCVSYFFHANGRYEQDPNRVRIRLQNLTERYAYFAKVELMTLLPPRPGATDNDPLRQLDLKEASSSMQSFLTSALPEVEKLLPDGAIFNR